MCSGPGAEHSSFNCVLAIFKNYKKQNEKLPKYWKSPLPIVVFEMGFLPFLKCSQSFYIRIEYLLQNIRDCYGEIIDERHVGINYFCTVV